MFKQWMAGLLALWAFGAWANDQLCAVVMLEIPQELSFERQAFVATMRINNGLDTMVLDELKVQVLFEDDLGNVVKASSDPNATDAAFFIRLDDSQNVNSLQSGADGAVTHGQVPASANGVLRWLIIPAAGAAGDTAAGKRYNVGASLSYNAGGKVESLAVTPDTIVVKPQPELTLDYFLTRDVIADDAFTPDIEAPEPYTLGVRIRNSGRGEVSGLKLESAQPRIIGNEMGVAINFRITQSFVDEAPAEPSLLLDFGRIAPGRNRNGRWIMESTLSGEFIDFSASFTHPDELGGSLTSLLKAANTYFLLRDVLVDLPTRDRIRDFLAFVGDDLYVFESDAAGEARNAPCSDCTAVRRLTAQLKGGSVQRTLVVSVEPGFGYARVPDPYAGSKGLRRVVRVDGTAVSPANAWLSKERSADGRTFDYYLNLFDTQPASEYAIEFGDLTQEPKPPVFQHVMDRSVHEGGQVGFMVRASDPNGTVPQLSVATLPVGASFKDEGRGRGTFLWAPTQGQAGRYVVNFKASDGLLETTMPVGIQVFRMGDSDGDGMDDDWEQEHFGDLDRDGTGDYDGDGISDLDEFHNDSDPTLADATPLPPQLYDPMDNAQVEDLYPALRVRNSPTQVTGQPLSYWFELYGDEAMSQLLAKSDAIAEGANTTEWVAKADQLEPGANLEDNRRYYWRVRVSHAKGSSEWLGGRFFINTANDSPSAPTLLDPTPLGLVSDTRPVFRFNNSVDVDEDPLTYRVRVYDEDDDDFSLPVVEVSGLLPGNDGVTAWQSPMELADGRFYFWLVEAHDPHGAVTPSEPSLFGVSLSNKAPSAPGLAWPVQDQQVAEAVGLTLRLDAAQDPERQPLQYRIQLDDNERFDSAQRIDSEWFSAGQAAVQWTVPVELREDQVYYWRARASDGELESEWVVGRFRVNQFQAPPPVPVANNPAEGAWIEVLEPRLSVHPVQDPDGDTVSYEFELYAAQGDQPLAAQVSTEPHWTVGFALTDNTWYRWRARSVDATGLFSSWGGWQRFFVNENGVDDAPTLSFVSPEQDLTLSGGSVAIQWVDTDPDSSATIDLYAGDLLIASGLPEDEDGDGDRFEWSLAGVAPGTYRIKAIIRDASSQVEAEACCSITVQPSTAQVQVTPLTPLELDEYGETVAEIEVSLSRAPKPGQSVMLNLAVTDPGEARLLNQPPYLYFTAENWQIPQRIRLRGEDDCEIDGPQKVGLELLPLHSSDPGFSGLDPQDVLLTTSDNEVEGQTLFVCHYQVLSRGEVDAEGMVDIVLRPELLNTGVALIEATATPSLQGDDIELSGTNTMRFSKVLNGISSQAHDSLVLRQPAGEPVLFSRIRWSVVAGDAAPVTEGQDGHDVLHGTAGSDIIYGGAGNDLIFGGDGDDVLIGGMGQDTLVGEGGDDTFIVTGEDQHADRVMGGAGYDQLLGGDGNDVIRLNNFSYDWRVELIDGRGGSNRIEGTEAGDVLDFRETELRNIDLIDGLAGNDIIMGSQGRDVIRGGLGSDHLSGNGGDDDFLFDGDQGVDRISGGDGQDRILGGPGDDWIRLHSFSPASSIELIDGGEGRNVITGDPKAKASLDFRETTLVNIERIEGHVGEDVIFGSQGADVILGSAGDDTLDGAGGNDVFLVQGSDAGFDLFIGGDGHDGIKGGPGDDVIGLRRFSNDARVEWIDGDGGFNRIRGTSGHDNFDFTETRLIGINEIDVGVGNDTVRGSPDSDVIVGGPGFDTLYGFDGDDTFLVSGADIGFDRIEGGKGFDRILGDEHDTVIGLQTMSPESSVELIDGGGGFNIVRGDPLANRLDFSATTLLNIARIEGGNGDDQILGSKGADVLVGGPGNDQLSGGPGDDTYRFSRGDGQDSVQDSGLLEDSDTLLLDIPSGPEQVWLKRLDNDLQVLLLGTTDQVLLLDVYGGGQNRVEQIVLANGQALPFAQAVSLERLMSAMPVNPAERTPEQREQLAAALRQAWGRP
ncbi:hypothetical protein A9C11_01665 [Pseudomonas citronellolis]|uniref:Ca2+-binding protein, RTX toxin-related n=1 Tax=Pseudomonas citronellolis TaxID=53408 RepID=A0A1A9K722_9PSED|nr:hypothetical protein [Pseudomonas citronellolis]ANI12763.1 hypothetical protein A9C11_01665 [Pseudomonas citronellolis]